MTSPLRRVAALGDIHAEDTSLDAVLRFLADQGLDAILSVGDIVDGPGDVERCIELLLEHEVYAVCGNHDRWALNDELRTLPDATQDLSLTQRRYLESLPATLEFETSLGPLSLCHGLAHNDMRGVTPDDFGTDFDLLARYQSDDSGSYTERSQGVSTGPGGGAAWSRMG